MATVDFQLEACPHCGSNAEVREHAVYRYQCKACGNPRIPTDVRWLATPPVITRNLKQVRGHRIQRGLWLAASWTLWLATVLCALFGAGTAWSLEFGVQGWTFVSVLTLLPLVLAVTTRVFASGQERQSVSRLEDAWREIAGHFFSTIAAQGRTAPTLTEVKSAFRVDHDIALRLLAEGEVAALLEQEVAGVHAEVRRPAQRVRLAPATSAHESSALDSETDATSEQAIRRSHTE